MLAADPKALKARYDAALRRLSAGQLNQAKADFIALLIPLPRSAEIHYQLSRIAHLQGDLAARAAHLGDALAIKPQEPALNEAAVAAFTATRAFDKALAAHDRLIAQTPGDLKRQADKGLTLQFAGDFDAAEALFRKLIRKAPDNGSLYRILTATRKLPANDPLMDRMRRLLANPKVPDIGKMHASYAMAKALEDQGRHGQVFAHLDRANALQRKAAPFDPDVYAADHRAIVAAQDADLTPLDIELPLRPVFVTGMPRSGTTLVEHILAAHSRVTAGGELGHAVRTAVAQLGDGTSLSPLDGQSAEAVIRFARSYVQHVIRDTGACQGVVTDKSILNHLIYGLLHRALPGARMIAVHRDPRDIALSIYKNHFQTGTHRYGNRLADIAPVIKAFRANIAHWRRRLPEGTLTEVRYEDLVADPESQTRALVRAAGLEWEDACLDFHSAGGTVRTLSLHQVRQPIYRASAQAWRKYETELAPFIAAWGDDQWD
ncbi:tetratricopeptide repeat-containing sulfotransferase family protein [Thalassococcus sp. BH17M4-6]|uniref:tetratricopeptide repeat-containing sulfotransferase family protein n=1 Tax=Thalassococcus sp. BH17M4-6 TaxID=3413148 RepID=UPI003BECB4F2